MAVEVDMVEIVRVKWVMLDGSGVRNDVKVERLEDFRPEQHRADNGCFEGIARSPSWGACLRSLCKERDS